MCEQIRVNQLERWPVEGREALRVAYAITDDVLTDVDAFDRLGSLLTILRMPVSLVVSALPVVVLGELEAAVAADGVGDTLEELRLRVLERAEEEVVSDDVLARVVEVEQTRRVIEGEALAAFEEVSTADTIELGQEVAECLLSAFAGAAQLVEAPGWKPVVGRRTPRGQEVQLLALVALRREARLLGALG